MTSRDKARVELASYQNMLREAERLSSRARILRARVMRSAPLLDPEHVHKPSGVSKGPEDLLAEIADMTIRADKLYAKSKFIRSKLLSKIEALDNKYFAQILKDYWLSGLQLKDVAKISYLSEGRVRNIHLEALDCYASKYF